MKNLYLEVTKGGVPLAEEMPYSIKIKENNYNSHMEPGKCYKSVDVDASFGIDAMPFYQ